MQKLIGVIPLYDDQRQSYWMIPGYLQMLEAAGAVPMVLPLTTNRQTLDSFLELCGGFLLTGGQDVSPAVYHAQRSPLCGDPCDARDEMEGYLLHRAIELDKSVLGICRGIQFMNACLGGTLYQDLDTEHPGGVNHHMAPPYDRAVHQVRVLPDTPLAAILQTEQLGVNSYHHQAIRELSPQVRPMAISEGIWFTGVLRW